MKSDSVADVVQAIRWREQDLEDLIRNEIASLRRETSAAADVVDAIVRERRVGIRLKHLRDCAEVTDIGTMQLSASQFPLRTGKYPFYQSGFETVPLDDFGFDDRRLLVGAHGAVSTFEGKLLVLTAQGRFAVSPAFHIVNPLEKDFSYLQRVLGSLDASRFARGSRAARSIELANLQGAVIPWPDESVRQLFVESVSACEDVGAENLGTHLIEYWMLAVRSIGRLEKGSETFSSRSDSLSEIEGGFWEDHTSDIFEIADGLLGAMVGECDEMIDVVASTSDLSQSSDREAGSVCVCFPEPNQGRWTGEPVDSEDPRWIFGPPPRNKANYAWIQQTVFCMAEGGCALMLLCNAPLHSEIGRERNIRRSFARSNLIDAIIALPGGLFADGRPPVSIVVLQKGRQASSPILFMDAQERGVDIGFDARGTMMRRLSSEFIEYSIGIYAKWKCGKGYRDEPGFCKEVSLDEIEDNKGLLTPWAYV